MSVQNAMQDRSHLSITNGDGSMPHEDPLDIALLDDFEDEAALINDVLAAGSTSSGISGETNNLSLLELDIKLARLMGILDGVAQETSAQVDQSIDDISRAVPRLTFDLQLMRENVILLRYTLDTIRKKSNDATTQSETNQVLRRLRVLDTVRTRLEAARDILREAEAWGSLESEVQALIQEQAYIKAAERLSDANKSLVVFQNSPEYDQRKALMVSLQNGLETGLAASLLSAIEAQDMVTCKKYYDIFVHIERQAEYQNYYFKSRYAAIVADWHDVQLADISPTSAFRNDGLPEKLSSYLPKFYATLVSLIQTEKKNTTAIFPEPLETLSAFIQSTFAALTPTLHQRLSAISNTYDVEILPELVVIYQATEACSLSLQHTVFDNHTSMDSENHGAANELVSSPPTKAETTRRYSKATPRRNSRGAYSASHSVRLIASITEAEVDCPPPREASPQKWETFVFEPFLDWQAEYADLESRLLQRQMSEGTEDAEDLGGFVLPAPAVGARVDDASRAQAFGDRLRANINQCEKALSRMVAFTHGYGAVNVTEAIDDALSSFLRRQNESIGRAKALRLRKRRDGLLSDSTSATADHSQEDWTVFQSVVRLLATTSDIYATLKALEAKMSTRFSEVSRLAVEARSNPEHQVQAGTTRGALLLLWQSSLNSASLANLLELCDTHHQSQTAHPRLLINARQAVLDIARTAQSHLLNTILLPLRIHLDAYAASQIWSQPSPAKRGGNTMYDLHVPSFSLSPSEHITRIGEGLFNLPAMFEIYAESQDLGYSLDTLEGLDAVTIAHIRRQHPDACLSVHADEKLERDDGLPRRHKSTASINGNEFLPATSQDQLDARQSSTIPTLRKSITAVHSAEIATPMSAELVISTWLSALTRTILTDLATAILPTITVLSSHGMQQLSADLEYLANVAKALDVEVATVEKWRIALSAEINVEAEHGGKGSDTDRSQVDTNYHGNYNEVIDVVKKLRVAASDNTA